MGILDTIRERLNLDGDGYYDDGPYDDEGDYYEEEPQEQHGLLGNTPRPEAQSVTVGISVKASGEGRGAWGKIDAASLTALG